ncbi:MAG: hypothetical protein Q9159_007170 [Coniocarpon cinnabarinum]
MPPPRLTSTAAIPSPYTKPSPTAPRESYCIRTLTTTTPSHAIARTKTFQPTRALADLPINTPPPYPYGPPKWYKQQNLGLYGGQTIQFGNNVSEQNEIKTRRTWHPNIKYKWLYSESLGRKIRVKLSTRVLRTIDKVGGLDEYVIGRGATRIRELGVYGWTLRWVVLQKMEELGRLEGRNELVRELERDRRVRAQGQVTDLDLEHTGQNRRSSLMEEEDGEERARDEDEEFMAGEREEGQLPHMGEDEATIPELEEKPGLLTRVGRTLTRPFRR